jgi:26 proteasome complex subunit DSS1
MSTTTTATPATNAKKDEEAKNTNKPLVEAIEEDDEFEEFLPAKWDASEEDAEDAQQWKDNWDDDDIEDDFTKNLRAELTKNSEK